MGTGVLICGLNGCGKSTLGRALAEKIGFHFLDSENLYFSESQADMPYAYPRPQEEVERLLREEVVQHPNFVFAAVKGNYGQELLTKYTYVVAIEAPREIRAQRLRERSFQKFGSRMLMGGDLYLQEEAFFQMAASRQEDFVEKWLESVRCPVIRVDGTKPVAENVAYIIRAMNR